MVKDVFNYIYLIKYVILLLENTTNDQKINFRVFFLTVCDGGTCQLRETSVKLTKIKICISGFQNKSLHHKHNEKRGFQDCFSPTHSC